MMFWTARAFSRDSNEVSDCRQSRGITSVAEYVTSERMLNYLDVTVHNLRVSHLFNSNALDRIDPKRKVMHILTRVLTL